MTTGSDIPEEQSTRSTAYKARLVGDFILDRLAKHKETAEDGSGPLMVAMHGPQGCGKTTLTNEVQAYLSKSDAKVKSAVLSLDDLYHTHADLSTLRDQHPENRLLNGRGLPGTHDLELARSTLEAIRTTRDGQLQLPIFDKSAFGGRGDRSTSTISIDMPIDVFILEGWSMGFQPLGRVALSARYEEAISAQTTSTATNPPVFLSHSLESLLQVDEYLLAASEILYPPFSLLVQVRPESYSYVYDWRRQQEHQLIALKGTGMTDIEVDDFVTRYMPGYELWAGSPEGDGSRWQGNSLVLKYGKDREVISAKVA